MDDSASPVRLRFTPFDLDEGNARLTRRGEAVALPPKAFAVLCALARQPGQLVTKGDLLDVVWGHRHVSESVLKTTVSELRAALGDDPRHPRFVETAHRRGYRFIAVPEAATGTLSPSGGDAWPATVDAADLHRTESGWIGRQDAIARLVAAWNGVERGRRRVVWIVGEAGIGKTTLVAQWIRHGGADRVGRGQCVEQFGAGEPYLPVLDALDMLCRGDPTLQPLMREVAPAWLLQMPWLLSTHERSDLQRELVGVHPDRMLRELSALFDRCAAQRPLLLVTEDLHWSDHATIRLIDHFARSRGSARVMWLATFRPADALAVSHPVVGLKDELRLQGACDEIALDPFSEHEVIEYLGARLAGADIPDRFARSLHAHTEGLPLFVVSVVDDLLAQGAVAGSASQASLDAVSQVPASIAGVIERRWQRLPDDLRSVVEAASVCGVEFRCETLAAALQREVAWVTERCEALDRQRYWLRHVTAKPRGPGSLDASYRFRHALYRHVIYERLGTHARASLHGRVARSLQESRLGDERSAPAELAFHFDLGCEPLAALRHYVAALESALARFAPAEALAFIDRATALLPACPPGEERLELELVLATRRGVACSLLQGIGSPQARQAFERAQVLCDSLPPSPQRAWVLSGLGWVAYSRGDYASSLALAKGIQSMSARFHDPLVLACAADLTGITLVQQGELNQARSWLERGISACEVAHERLPNANLRIVDPDVSMRSIISIPLGQLGLVDQARVQVDAALARARSLDQPVAEMLACWCAAALEARLERPDGVLAHADSLERLRTEHGLAPAEGPSLWFRGWVRARRGDPQAGHASIMAGYAAHERLGRLAGGTQVLAYAAEAMVLAGDWVEASKHVQMALGLAERLGERICVPDLLVLQGRIVAGAGDAALARRSMLGALELARAQGALWLELVALSELCELDAGPARHVEELRAAFARLREGCDAPLVARVRQRLGRAVAR